MSDTTATTTHQQRFSEYLNIIAAPDSMRKIARLEFLNPDGSVAFSIDNNRNKNTALGKSRSKAFLQSGTLNVSLQNGQRRKASIEFANLDKEFDFSVNKLWFGQQIRLSMGAKLSDGTDFYLPQGVFYIDSPSLEWKPNSRKATYNLVDKWSYLDGSLFGNLRETYKVPIGSNIFSAMLKILQINRYTLAENTEDSPVNLVDMIDAVTPMFTDYFNKQDTDGDWLNQVYDEILVEYGNTYADILTQLNNLIAGWVGYDCTGRLTVLPSEDDIEDTTKPVLWNYTAASKTFLGLTETAQMSDVYNELLMVGEAISSKSETTPYAIAQNNDPNSDICIQKIGCKTQSESGSGYYKSTQCADLARFRLKRLSVLQKQVTITSSQMFHLQENSLITVKRTDKDGSPTERHLIQSFSVPISETGTMSITATSVMDYPSIEITESGVTE